jgi:hypothetical protein
MISDSFDREIDGKEAISLSIGIVDNVFTKPLIESLKIDRKKHAALDIDVAVSPLTRACDANGDVDFFICCASAYLRHAIENFVVVDVWLADIELSLFVADANRSASLSDEINVIDSILLAKNGCSMIKFLTSNIDLLIRRVFPTL